MNRPAEPKLILTCEHGGNAVPSRYGTLFAGRRAMLHSHRGWDPGALDLAKVLSLQLQAPLYAATVSRLLVDLNRSIGRPGLFSAVTGSLPHREQAQIVRCFYTPYRRTIERAVAAAARVVPVIHVSVHTFTPVFRGTPRPIDVGLLFDPARDLESRLCAAWREQLLRLLPDLRVRFNAPYRGTDDGFTTHLRTIHPDARYAGVEVEVNQRFARRQLRAWPVLQQSLAESLGLALKNL